MKKQRPGSWSILIATMALSYALVRWVATQTPYLVAPLTSLVKFIVDRYEEEIKAAGNWIARQFISIWNHIRRPAYAVTCS